MCRDQDLSSGRGEKPSPGFSCRLLDGADWATYRAIRLAGLADSGDYDRQFKESTFDESYWCAEVTDLNNKKFGLFSGENIIGITIISFNQKFQSDYTCEFTGSYILKDYRNQKLGNMLFEARMSYLQNHGGASKVFTKVFNENIASQRVVERNNFTYVGTVSEDNDSVLCRVYCKDVKLEPCI